MTDTTADRVLAALRPYRLKRQRDGQYRADCPWRPNSDSHSLVIRITDGEHGAYYYHAGDGGGSLYDLADKLGIEHPTRATGEGSSKRVYVDGEDYARQHGLTWSDLEAAGYTELTRKGRPALSFPTANGTRYRYLDGNEPRYESPVGYTPSWYRLDVAVQLAEQDAYPIVLCNGEISTLAAQHRGIPATTLAGGGERVPPAHLIDQLKQVANQHREIWIAFDCDLKGRRAAEDVRDALKAVGLDATVVDLGGEHGFDLADFCRLHDPDAMAELARRAALPPAAEEPVAPVRARPLDVNDLLALPRKPIRWYAPGFLREGFGLLVGQPNVGKTPAVVQLAIACATGGKWLNAVRCEQTPTLYLGVEYSAQELIPLIEASTFGQPIPRGMLHIKTVEDDFPKDPESAIAELEWYITQMGIGLIIIDVLTAFLPPEKFKQNVYRGDYAELKPYHQLALRHNAAILGTWHGSKREADPRLMYNGSTGLWAVAASRITMYTDQEQRVRIASFPRMGDKIDWALTQQVDGKYRRWAVADVAPEPVMGPQELEVYRWLKAHSDKANPKTPATIGEMTGVPQGSIRTVLGRMFDKNLIQRSGNGYYVDVTPVTPVTDVTLVTPVTDVTDVTPERDKNGHFVTPLSHLNTALESDKHSRDKRDINFQDTPRDTSILAQIPESKRFILRMRLRSNNETDQERAKELCAEYGIDYEQARKEVT